MDTLSAVRDDLGAREIHKPADPDASRAADLFDTEIGKLDLSDCRVIREIGCESMACEWRRGSSARARSAKQM
jgi:hypothetical protein